VAHEGSTVVELRGEAERYRQAAEDTLAQLDWCIAYLQRNRSVSLARALERNRREIARALS